VSSIVVAPSVSLVLLVSVLLLLDDARDHGPVLGTGATKEGRRKDEEDGTVLIGKASTIGESERKLKITYNSLMMKG
jgi:hypothetical protein